MSSKCDLQESKDALNKKDKKMQNLVRKLGKKDKLICEKNKVIQDIGSTHETCRVILGDYQRLQNW